MKTTKIAVGRGVNFAILVPEYTRAKISINYSMCPRLCAVEFFVFLSDARGIVKSSFLWVGAYFEVTVFETKT
jgi:hypothetical protein